MEALTYGCNWGLPRSHLRLCFIAQESSVEALLGEKVDFQVTATIICGSGLAPCQPSFQHGGSDHTTYLIKSEFSVFVRSSPKGALVTRRFPVQTV